MAKITCTCCDRVLNPKTMVALELDQRVWEYHDFGGVPSQHSQGWFDFGQTCAMKTRAQARAKLDKAGLASKPVQVVKLAAPKFDDVALEAARRSGMLTASQGAKAARKPAAKRKLAKLKRASYRDAIFWIANNDDTQWIDDDYDSLSVTACLVADLFGADQDRVREDIRREIEKRDSAKKGS